MAESFEVTPVTAIVELSKLSRQLDARIEVGRSVVGVLRAEAQVTR